MKSASTSPKSHLRRSSGSPNQSTNFDGITQNYSNLPTRSPKKPIPRPISPRQRVAIDFLLFGRTDTAIVAMLKVSRKTLYNWRNSPLFRQALDDRRHELYAHRIDLFNDSLSQSVMLLRQQLTNPDPYVSLKAANSILRASRVGQYIYEQAHDY